MMSGEVEVESSSGKGSTFTVKIPQKPIGDSLGREVCEKLENLQTYSKSLDKTLQFNIEPMPYGRVLVVDDVEANLYVAEGILSPYKIEVETTQSGIEAIANIKSGKVYDIIFMDHMMPEMDGIETVKNIREMGYIHPIIALTANAVKGSESMFISSGFSGFISKPIDIIKLNEYLIRFVRDKNRAC